MMSSILQGCAALERLNGKPSLPESVQVENAPVTSETSTESTSKTSTESTSKTSTESTKEKSQSVLSTHAEITQLKKVNKELRRQLNQTRLALQQQQREMQQIKKQWVTNFSLLEKGVAESLRENQQLIAELQHLQKIQNPASDLSTSESTSKKHLNTSLTADRIQTAKETPHLNTSLTADRIPTARETKKSTEIFQIQNTPLVETVSLIPAQQEVQQQNPNPNRRSNIVNEAESTREVTTTLQKNIADTVPETAPSTTLLTVSETAPTLEEPAELALPEVFFYSCSSRKFL